MKTLMVILGLVVGTSFAVNAQTQSQTKPAGTTHPTTQPAAQAPAQAPSQTKAMIKLTELSKPIQENLSAQFKGWTPTQAYKLDSKGVISYEVLVKKQTNEMRLYYDNAGKYLREEPVAMSKNTTPAKHTTQAAPAQKPTTKPQ